MYWLDLIKQSGYFAPARIDPLIRDFNKAVAMVVKSIKTIKSSTAPKANKPPARDPSTGFAQPTKIQNPKSKTSKKED